MRRITGIAALVLAGVCPNHGIHNRHAVPAVPTTTTVPAVVTFYGDPSAPVVTIWEDDTRRVDVKRPARLDIVMSDDGDMIGRCLDAGGYLSGRVCVDVDY